MTISVNCDACGKVYSLKTEAAGQTFVCQACGGQVEVPSRWEGGSAQPVADSSPTSAGNVQPLPGTTTGSTPSGGQQAALGRVKLPAIFMMVIAGLSILTNLVAFLFGIFGVVSGANSGGYQGEELVIGGTFYIISGALGVIANIIILVGSWKMKSLKAYGFSLGVMILAMIPCNACCMITFPLSIWGLVVLNDANVKAAFKSSR
jgi:hypothetical protein